MPKNFLFFLFILFSLLFTGKSIAQEPDDPINIHSFNEKYLEHLIKEKIDSVRQAHHLKTLYNDSILYVAAKFHARYLFTKKELNHNEPENPKTETPQKRAEYFGAVNYLVGENIAFTYINEPAKDKKGKVQTNTTYNQTATDFAIMWVNSPPHYKNIITPDYNATGVAIWADQKTGRIYGVQKFALILYKYDFKENTAFFSYSNYVPPPVVRSFDGIERRLHTGRHVHKLKNVSSASQCARCDSNSAFQFGLSRIFVKNDKIVFTSYDITQVFNLLQKKKDGFAVELISYNPYDCGNPAYYLDPSRRNGQCVFSGKVLKPVYRKKALKGFRAGKTAEDIQKKIEKGKVKKYEITLGKFPKDIPAYTELNFVIIQKKRVCRVMRFSGYCGDTLERFYDLPLYVDSVPDGIEIKESYKNVEFAIPFQKGKTEYNMKDIKPITDSLLSESFTADSVIIHAYSSLEGKESINKKLQEERAEQIAKALAANQKEKLNTKIVSEENWTLFEKQIREKDALKEFRGQSREKIKLMLEDTLRLRKLEPFLKEQRVAHIRLRAREIINEKNVEAYLTAKIKEKKARINKLILDESKKGQLKDPLDSMKLFMRVAYMYIQNKTIKPEFFRKFSMGYSKLLDDYNILRMQYKVCLDSSGIHDPERARELYEDAVSLYNNKNSSFFINYNMLTLIQKYGKEMNVFIREDQQDNYLFELRTFVKDSVQSKLADKLEVNFWFKICRQTREETPNDQLALHDKCLNRIYGYFSSRQLSLEEKNKVAYYYIYHSMPAWALELLWPDYEQKVNNPQGLAILAKILYENYQETANDKYYDFLKEIYERMGKETWCPMFVGPCNISFQAFDNEPFRNFYCEKCKGYLNYAKDPKQWK